MNILVDIELATHHRGHRGPQGPAEEFVSFGTSRDMQSLERNRSQRLLGAHDPWYRLQVWEDLDVVPSRHERPNLIDNRSADL